ncbi:hypothetical protein EDC01DRAFT_201929 [Geopyxis carbonaria]|nr:hypothetical protein EDC01DRAFT_201929 [Geopyxis carbonaria]
MDKLLSRAHQAKAQAARRLQKHRDWNRRKRLTSTRKEHVAFQKIVSSDRKESRAEEKIDFRLGPMAPRRVVGKKEIEELGAFDQQRMIPPPVPVEYRIRNWNIVVNDRVVVLKGPDRHKIGLVKSIDRDSNSVTVEKLNMMPMKVPAAFKEVDPNTPDVMLREAPIHYNDVRLVYPLPDPITGELKDSVIANIAMSKIMHYKNADRKRQWTRYVSGTTTKIPWPKVEEPEAFDMPCDTRIMDVETRTYVPTMLKPPFPSTVVDELRNKYSVFRVRHEPEFVAKIEALAKADREKKKQVVLTPLQELNRKLRKERKVGGKPKMTADVMEQIGRIMAQNRPELLEKVKAVA